MKQMSIQGASWRSMAFTQPSAGWARQMRAACISQFQPFTAIPADDMPVEDVLTMRQMSTHGASWRSMAFTQPSAVWARQMRVACASQIQPMDAIPADDMPVEEVLTMRQMSTHGASWRSTALTQPPAVWARQMRGACVSEIHPIDDMPMDDMPVEEVLTMRQMSTHGASWRSIAFTRPSGVSARQMRAAGIFQIQPIDAIPADGMPVEEVLTMRQMSTNGSCIYISNSENC